MRHASSRNFVMPTISVCTGRIKHGLSYFSKKIFNNIIFFTMEIK